MKLPDEDVIFCLEKLRSEVNQPKLFSKKVESCHMIYPLLAESVNTQILGPRGRCCVVSSYSPGSIFSETKDSKRPMVVAWTINWEREVWPVYS